MLRAIRQCRGLQKGCAVANWAVGQSKVTEKGSDVLCTSGQIIHAKTGGGAESAAQILHRAPPPPVTVCVCCRCCPLRCDGPNVLPASIATHPTATRPRREGTHANDGMRYSAALPLSAKQIGACKRHHDRSTSSSLHPSTTICFWCCALFNHWKLHYGINGINKTTRYPFHPSVYKTPAAGWLPLHIRFIINTARHVAALARARRHDPSDRRV